MCMITSPFLNLFICLFFRGGGVLFNSTDSTAEDWMGMWVLAEGRSSLGKSA